MMKDIDQNPLHIRLAVFSLTLFLVIAACVQSSPSDPPEEEASSAAEQPTDGTTQHLLSIDLQEGFSDESVQLFLDEALLAEQTNVTTSLLLGLATTVETEAGGSIKLTVTLPQRDLSEEVLLEITADTYVGISLVDDRLIIMIRDQPFGYG